MSTFTVGKPSHIKNDSKNASLAMKSRQKAINEVNKRRTLLQDNSWIKKRPDEESSSENYGRVVLNQYKSQDSLHRNLEGEKNEKAMLNRYRSDTTLDRIPGGSNTDKANTSPVLDSRINKRIPGGSNTDKANTSPVLDSRINKSRDLESLIVVRDNNSKEGNKDLDDFIVVNYTFEPCDKSGYQDVEDLIEVNRISNQKGKFSDLDSFIEIKDKSNQRAIIGKELCTYCQKPLGTETKMILEALNICCHATCFKCEICKATLENLEAGDNIWIYKNIVHCSPCYSHVKATWTY